MTEPVSSQTRPSLPPSFHARTIHRRDGAEIYVRSGGSGPVVVLIHGYAENSDSWAPLAAGLVKDYTVVVPDLHECSKIPTVPAEIRTSPFPICSLLTVVSNRSKVIRHGR